LTDWTVNEKSERRKKMENRLSRMLGRGDPEQCLWEERNDREQHHRR
jgi:hypothetical protein